MNSGLRKISAIAFRGRDVVEDMNEAIKADLARLPEGCPAPKLAILRAGERPDDIAYENSIIKRFAGIGLDTLVRPCPETIGQEEFLADLHRMNGDAEIHGILVLRPLPEQIDSRIVAEAIDPRKDVDGISPVNMAKVFAGDAGGFAPCTAAAVVAMLDYANVELSGKRVAVIGRSLVVGKPLSMLLLGRNATVTVCHSKTQDLPAVCREAEILVACVGRAKMLTGDYIRPGATVIDVGINLGEDGKYCGDVDFAAAQGLAGAITPVPGGVGTVTTSILAQQLIRAAKGLRRA